MSETPRTDTEFVRIRRDYRGAGDGALAAAEWYARTLERESDGYKFRLAEQQQRQTLNLEALEQEVRDSIALRSLLREELEDTKRKLADSLAQADALKRECEHLQHELRDAVRSAKEEAVWKNMQGDEYGTY